MPLKIQSDPIPDPATMAGDVPRFGLLHTLATGALFSDRSRRPLEVFVLVGLILLLALAGWVIAGPDSGRRPAFRNGGLSVAALTARATLADDRPLDTAVAPKVEPIDYFQVPADVARQVNARIPFSTSPLRPARPFILTGTPAEHERAMTCLALAAYYEAGDDSAGQAAVIQVILNRLRHPAFPKNVCGVVLQGSDRATGCQFTFTCDGSMARRAPSPDQLARARYSAERGLTGGVFVVVGTATHYHTDWVLPRWSAQMDKITAFHGHLFFRWRGGWGMPAAFSGRYDGPEASDARFLRFAAPTADPALASDGGILPSSPALSPPQLPSTVQVAGMGQVAATGGVVKSDEARHIYYILFAGDDYPGSYAITAWKICAGKAPCTVYGWRSAADIPQIVQSARPNGVTFAFQKSDTGSHQSLWNCRQIARDNKSQCIAGTTPALTVAATSLPTL